MHPWIVAENVAVPSASLECRAMLALPEIPRHGDRPELAVRVLHIGGWAYCGSTLLANVVAASSKDLFAAGELRLIWRRLTDGGPCGCGAPVVACPVWSEVIRLAFGGPARVDAERLAALDRRLLRNWRAPWYVVGRPGGIGRRRAFDEYSDVLTVLYGAVRTVTGCAVIVDTSKPPLYGLLLTALPTLDVTSVQLVRDPRGYLLSRHRRSLAGKPADSGPGSLLTLAIWDVNHVAFELAGRTHRRGRHRVVRYEDFAREPLRTTRAVLQVARLPGEAGAWQAANRIVLPPNHMVAGNQRRLESGTVEIVPDEAWRTELPSGLRALGVAATWPLLARHGYLGRRPVTRGSEEPEQRLLGVVDQPRQTES
jgi:hypothetical protein